MTTTKDVFVALDIEMGGRSPIKHPLLAIGACLAQVDSSGKVSVIDKLVWCLRPFEGQALEARCVEEFWVGQNLLPLLGQITARAKDPLVALSEFDCWLNSLQGRFPEWNIVFVSDNPAYDIGILDFVLMSRGIRHDQIRYLADGKYRKIHDPSEMMRGQGHKEASNLADAEVAHDHWPANDAEHHVRTYVHALKMLETR